MLVRKTHLLALARGMSSLAWLALPRQAIGVAIDFNAETTTYGVSFTLSIRICTVPTLKTTFFTSGLNPLTHVTTKDRHRCARCGVQRLSVGEKQ